MSAPARGRAARRRFARTRKVARVMRHPGRAAKQQARRVSRRLQRQVRAAAARRVARMRRAWRQHHVHGGPTPRGVQRHKVTMPASGPAPTYRPTTTTSRPRPAGGKPTMLDPQFRPTDRTYTPETEMIRKGAQGMALWVPGRPMEVHWQLSGAALAVARLGAGLLAYAETLAAVKADPRRIVNPLTDIALAITSNGGDLVKLDRTFRSLYRGDIEQDEQPATRMQYPAAA